MATTENTTLGQRIREARRSAGFKNIETLAVKLEVAHRTLQRWETDESQPSIDRLRQIAALTDRPLVYFIGAEEQAA